MFIFFDRELEDVCRQTRFPSLRYLRRYGRVCHISMPVLTLARLNYSHLTNIDIHLLPGIFWSLALWNTASTSKSVNQRWLYWRTVGILAPAKPRLRWRPSSWPWRWRTLRWGSKHRRILSLGLGWNFMLGMGGNLEILQQCRLYQGNMSKILVWRPVQQIQTVSGGANRAEDACDASAAPEGEHEDHTC